MKPSARLACPWVQVSCVAKILPPRLYRQTGYAPILTSSVPSSGTSDASATFIQLSLMSKGIDQAVRDEEAVENADLFLEFQPALLDDELVAVLTGVEDSRELVLQRLERDIVRAHLERSFLPAEDANTAHDAAHVTRCVHRGLSDRGDPVGKISLALAKPGRERQTTLEVLARNDLVETLFNEEFRPFLEALFVQAGCVRGIELLQFQAQVPGIQGEITFRRAHGMEKDERSLSLTLLITNNLLELHDLPIVSVERADDGFRDHMLFVFPVASTHLHDAGPFWIRTDTGLGEFHHFAVVDRDESRGAHEVRLPQPAPGHALVVVGVAEIGPGELERCRTARNQLAHRQGVRLLLDDEVGPERSHDHGIFRKLAHRIEKRRILQLEVVDQRLHVDVVLGLPLIPSPGNQRTVTTGCIHLHFRGLIGAKQPEAHQEHVQQARVIGVLDVLEHQFPVGGCQLARVSEHAKLAAVEHAVEKRRHRRAEIFFERLQIRRKGREDHPVAARDLELAQPVVLRIEVRGHAALLLHAAPERDPDQIALQVVGPLVIGTHELGRVAEMLLTELHTPVGAAVLHDIDRAFLVAHHHDRLLADEGALEIAGTRQLRFERYIAPARTGEDALLLPSINLRVGIDPVGNAGDAFWRPYAARAHW